MESFEENLGNLESGELELEDALKRYEEGVRRLKSCYEMLAKAEQQVKKLVGDEEEPFEPEEPEA